MTNKIDGFFNKLYFLESTLHEGYGDGNCFCIPVEGLLVLADHPLSEKGDGPYKGEFVFSDVTSSRKEIFEYVGDPKSPDGFKPAREIIDSIFTSIPDNDQLIDFHFEGYLASPSAWVGDWVVRARSFSLKIIS